MIKQNGYLENLLVFQNSVRLNAYSNTLTEWIGLSEFFFFLNSRGVRGHRQETRKNSVKLGKNDKNRLKNEKKNEILAQENFQKQGNQLKKGSFTPL